MILVDSSVWIDYFRGIETEQTVVLDKTLGVELIAVGDLILAEVLQGFRRDEDYMTAKSLFDTLSVFDMLGRNIAIASAENYRYLRKQGITVRKTIDVIIASVCINQRIPLLFSDREFEPFVDHMGLVDAVVT